MLLISQSLSILKMYSSFFYSPKFRKIESFEVIMDTEYIEDGYIKLSRKVFNSKTFSNLNAIQKLITIYLILMANHQDNEWWDKYHKKFVIIKRGSFISSIENIKKILNDKLITTKKIRTVLELLKKMQFLAIDTASGYSHITIVKYDLYQNGSNYEGKQKGKQRARVGQAEGKGRATNKNDKNGKNGNNEKKIKHLDKVFLTSTEYDKLIKEYYKNIIDDKIEDLNYYLVQHPKKTYASHYLTIRAWIRRDKKGDQSERNNQNNGQLKEPGKNKYSHLEETY